VRLPGKWKMPRYHLAMLSSVAVSRVLARAMPMNSRKFPSFTYRHCHEVQVFSPLLGRVFLRDPRRRDNRPGPEASCCGAHLRCVRSLAICGRPAPDRREGWRYQVAHCRLPEVPLEAAAPRKARRRARQGRAPGHSLRAQDCLREPQAAHVRLREFLAVLRVSAGCSLGARPAAGGTRLAGGPPAGQLLLAVVRGSGRGAATL
jgi:hypothetical protein